MLPADLAVIRVRRGRVYPAFSTLKEEELFVASEVIEAFRESLGRRRAELEEKLRMVETAAFRLGCHYKLARGLAHILRRRAVFRKPEVKIDPFRARIETFRAAASLGGLALTEEERRRALEEASRKLGVSVGDLWAAFESAYEENEVLVDFEEPTPEDLLRDYNLSLAQTVLFKALMLRAEVRASGGEAKILLRNTKRLGLMYMARRERGRLVLDIDGPASLLRQTERYGTRLAKLLPSIVALREWRVVAWVKRKERRLLFEMSSERSPPLPRLELKYEPYDSSIEEDFYRRFSKAGSGWAIHREPEPLVVDGHVLVPDFAFDKGEVRVYMEIVGFWTPGYLKRKVKKLRALRGVNMIVAVDKEKACSPEVLSLPHTVVVFKRKVPIDAIYRLLKGYERSYPKPRVGRGVRAYDRKVYDYLSSITEKPLIEVEEELARLGVPREDAARLIEEAGLVIEWRSIDPRDAVVRRRS